MMRCGPAPLRGTHLYSARRAPAAMILIGVSLRYFLFTQYDSGNPRDHAGSRGIRRRNESMRMLKKPLLGLLAILVVLSVTGCNTVRGVGKDLKKGGEAIERAAD